MTSLYWTGNKDHRPEHTQRRVLTVLVDAPRPMSRRAIQNVVFDTDRFGAGQTLAAIRFLHERQLIETAYDPWTGTRSRLWKATDAGRAALALAEAMDESEAS